MQRRHLLKYIKYKAAGFNQIVLTLIQQEEIEPLNTQTKTRDAIDSRIVREILPEFVPNPCAGGEAFVLPNYPNPKVLRLLLNPSLFGSRIWARISFAKEPNQQRKTFSFYNYLPRPRSQPRDRLVLA